MKLDRAQAKVAYEELIQTYCHDQPLPPKEAIERLTELDLSTPSSVHWVSVWGEFGAEQDELDRALYGAPRPST